MSGRHQPIAGADSQDYGLMPRRIRRCAGLLAEPCHAPATIRVHVTYLAVPLDRDAYFCDAHGARVDELLRDGYKIAGREAVS